VCCLFYSSHAVYYDHYTSINFIAHHCAVSPSSCYFLSVFLPKSDKPCFIVIKNQLQIVLVYVKLPPFISLCAVFLNYHSFLVVLKLCPYIQYIMLLGTSLLKCDFTMSVTQNSWCHVSLFLE